jgi:hypothetical protein
LRRRRSPYDRIRLYGRRLLRSLVLQQFARRSYEREDRVGGLLRYRIPDFKMQKHLIDRRMAQMAAEGVTFRRLPWEAYRRGRPRALDAVLFLAIWMVPARARERLGRLLGKSRRPTTSG